MTIDGIASLAQKCFQNNPVIIFGSGASIAHGIPGVPELQDHLTNNLDVGSQEEHEAWEPIRILLDDGQHLEQALDGRVLPQTLVQKIVSATWKFINERDHAMFLRALAEQENFPAGALFKALFASSNTTVEVVTTNYDRVVEYACNSVGIFYAAGYDPGYIQHKGGAQSKTLHDGKYPVRTVRLWKVHGSLDWFERPNGTTIAAPVFEHPENNFTPLIVTPGVSKYQRTHDEPFRSAIQGADQSLEKANGYLCIGYGFRDSHIEPKLVERCRKDGIPITIITKALTDEARSFLAKSAGEAYLALEESAHGTRAYTAEYPQGLEIPDQSLWSLNEYMDLVT